MSVAALLLLLLLSAVVLAAPRRYALLALMAGILFLGARASFEVAGLNIFPMRALGLVAFVRVVIRREFGASRINALDSVLLGAYAYATAIYLARTAFGLGTSADVEQTSTMSKIGDLVDVVLFYVACRGLVRTADDLRVLLRGLAVLLVPFVGCLLVERLSGSNPLAALGSFPYVWVDDDGSRVRSMGTFMHPSLLGTAGAAFLAMYGALVLGRGDRVVGAVGASLSLAIVLLANSGGPLGFVAVAAIAWACWWLRRHMGVVWSTGLMGLFLLALLMNSPIWFLPARVSALFGGSGWHRAHLIDQAIQHVDQWWLVGMPLDATRAWFPYLVGGAADMTNLFVVFGIDGGLAAMVALVAALVIAFRRLGQARAALVQQGAASEPEQLLLWGLGAALVGHVVNLFAITYFDQTASVWLLQLACIGSLTAANVCRDTSRAAESPLSNRLAAARGLRGALPYGSVRRRPNATSGLEGRAAARSELPPPAARVPRAAAVRGPTRAASKGPAPSHSRVVPRSPDASGEPRETALPRRRSREQPFRPRPR